MSSHSVGPHRVVSVILAAGESTRMSFPKALARLDGESFLDRVLAVHATLTEARVVVLGFHHEEISRSIDLSAVNVVVNPNPERGQLSSLQEALCFLSGSPAVLVHPVDHPLVRRRTLSRLLRAHRAIPGSILIPRHGDRKGHPVLFPGRFVAELLGAPVEKGARRVVHQNPGSVLQVEVQDPGILENIDTPAQLQEAALALRNRNRGVWQK